MTQPKWETITREERYFTCILFHDMVENIQPMYHLLRDKLRLPNKLMVSDIGYEVCFFRDSRHGEVKLIKSRRPKLEKQTFDLVLWLSDQSMIIIEAKAQQSFHNNQLGMLKKAKGLIQELSVNLVPNVYLVGLCSSKYTPKNETKQQLDTVITWVDIARVYSTRTTNQAAYIRADSLHRK